MAPIPKDIEIEKIPKENGLSDPIFLESSGEEIVSEEKQNASVQVVMKYSRVDKNILSSE